MSVLHINPDKPDHLAIKRAADILRLGGIIIYPTDTVYGIGCDITKPLTLERLCKLKGIPVAQSNFSIICHDLSHLSDFTVPINTPVFRVLKKALPGPYTFILEANHRVPKFFLHKKKTIGIRVPDNTIVSEIVRELGNPIVSSSAHSSPEELLEFVSDPEAIFEKYKDLVDLVINGGYPNMETSTVIDATGGAFEVIRPGLGATDNLW
ncbi:MAG TPA: L-threonylcarbamoyladenylate synthase [Bacteroidia bacterium]|nr:L-threonylcarbamoyladenylate synthase [Bacteroidia bacterium]